MTLNQLKEKDIRKFENNRYFDIVDTNENKIRFEAWLKWIDKCCIKDEKKAYQTALQDVLKVMPKKNKKFCLWGHDETGIERDMCEECETAQRAIDTITKAIKKLNKHF